MAVVFAAIGAAATAQTFKPTASTEGRFCAYADVVGLWDSTVQRADEKGVAQQNAIAPHDYMRFAPGGAMMYFGTPRAMSDAAQIDARLTELDRMDGESYRAEVATPGALIIYRNGAPFQGFTCVVARDGKMIWTQLQGQPALRRTQVRLR
jgi:hypothetical protein